MIITRSPLRISLGGGGTDLPSYYNEHGGFLIAGAIDRYVYVTVIRPFIEGIFLKYSELEHVDTVDKVKHPIIRESLKLVGLPDPAQIELTTLADIPSGTGLGSSGSFTTALLQALQAYQRRPLQPTDLAEAACDIELNKLGEPIGKQDQYIAAYGGLTCFEFERDQPVKAYPLNVSDETLFELEDNLLLFFTGYSRSASKILKEQDDKSKDRDQDMTDNLNFVKDLGRQTKDVLEKGDLIEFGRLMDVHWQHKKRRSGNMSNQDIDVWYDAAMKNGAVGGKVIGAGGGGFLMFYARDKARLRQTMQQLGLREVRFRFDFEGTKILASD